MFRTSGVGVLLREFEQPQEPQGQVAGVPQGDLHGDPGSDQFLSPGAMTSAQSYVSAQSQEVQEGATRSVWMSFGEMFQRRVVTPVVNASKSLTTTATTQGHVDAPTALLLRGSEGDVHSSRPSLISPQHRRQEEEASSSSLNQDMIMDEVKRQVARAMQDRDQEVVSLKQKNKDLERALVEANKAMRSIRVGEMQSTSTARPEENRGNLEGDPLAVGGGYSGHLGDPAPSVLNASVPVFQELDEVNLALAQV